MSVGRRRRPITVVPFRALPAGLRPELSELPFQVGGVVRAAVVGDTVGTVGVGPLLVGPDGDAREVELVCELPAFTPDDPVTTGGTRLRGRLHRLRLDAPLAAERRR